MKIVCRVNKFININFISMAFLSAPKCTVLAPKLFKPTNKATEA